jgi:hypothetical protein
MIDWRKSSHSFSNGDCAEVASWRKSAHSNGTNCAEAGTCTHGVAVRDSKDPDGPVLTFPGSTWGRFLAEVRRTPATP